MFAAEYRLNVDMIPRTSWFKNLRSELKKPDWDYVRKSVYKFFSYRCGLCNGVGPEWPVECHEVWEYQNGTQKLSGLIALCPDCHLVQHAGLAEIKGKTDVVLAQLQRVNNVSEHEADLALRNGWEVWNDRNLTKWKLDISLVHEFLKSKDVNKLCKYT